MELTFNRIQSFIPQSVLRQATSPFQSQFFAHYNLVLFLSIYNIIFYPLRSSNSCLRLLLLLPVTFILPSIIPSITCFKRQFLRKLWPIQSPFLRFIVCRIFLSSLTPCNTSSISHTTGPTDLLHPSSAPQSKIFPAVLIYFPKCPMFSITKATLQIN